MWVFSSCDVGHIGRNLRDVPESGRVTVRRGPVAEATDPLRRDDDDFLERWYHPTLVAALRRAGGSWSGGDHYASPSAITEAARERDVAALRLDMRDLSLLRGLPLLRYLHVCTDGRPVLDPVATLRGLRSLHLTVSALRGELDPLGFPDLRWLTLPLGGKGGAAVLPSVTRGHSGLEHLSVRETRVRSLGELVAGFPRLRSLAVSFADFIRSPGDLSPVGESLRELDLSMVPGLRSLDGIEQARGLERVRVHASGISDLTPLEALPALRHVDVWTGSVRVRTDAWTGSLAAHVD
jgi:hypothetical protein